MMAMALVIVASEISRELRCLLYSPQPPELDSGQPIPASLVERHETVGFLQGVTGVTDSQNHEQQRRCSARMAAEIAGLQGCCYWP